MVEPHTPSGLPTDAWLQEQQQVTRFHTILRVIERRARALDVTVEAYFAGIVAGTYPKVEQSEIDALYHDN
jgi:hypothetical protein